MIFGVAVSQFTINIRKKDPLHPERWLICYDVALLFVPMALFGCGICARHALTHAQNYSGRVAELDLPFIRRRLLAIRSHDVLHR